HGGLTPMVGALDAELPSARTRVLRWRDVRAVDHGAGRDWRLSRTPATRAELKRCAVDASRLTSGKVVYRALLLFLAKRHSINHHPNAATPTMADTISTKLTISSTTVSPICGGTHTNFGPGRNNLPFPATPLS